MAGSDAKAIVEDFLAAFSSGNVDAILSRMHDDATWSVSGRIEGMSGTYGRDQFGELLRGVGSLYVEGRLRITPSVMIAEGNKVAVEAESHAQLSNGRVYNNFYHFLFEVADGKVLRVKEYMDTEHARATFF